MKDVLLEMFLYDEEIHKNSVEHARGKGADISVLDMFCMSQSWAVIADLVENGRYHTKPTRICYLDKNSGNPLTYHEAVEVREMKKVREIYVMDTLDRIVWNTIYQICYRLYHPWIHPSCKSYKKGESTRTVARELSRRLKQMGRYKGYKHDLAKYFDSVPIEVIDRMLDKMETKHPSCIWKVVREFYHDNRVVINGEETERYGSLKQGCAFACLLADLILYDVDAEMSKFDVAYYRYSDDLIIIGKDCYKAEAKLQKMVAELGLKINEEKTEYLGNREWFTFLGFSFKNGMVSITKKTMSNLKAKIKAETIGKSNQLHRALTKKELEKAIDEIQYYFFTGCEKCDGGMAAYLFGAVNVKEDIDTLDEWIKECIRGAYTNRTEIWSPGISRFGECRLLKCDGKNSGRNKLKAYDLPRELGWYSLNHMFRKYHSGSGAYKAEVLKMKNGIIIEL